jgi:hypothetical protein
VPPNSGFGVDRINNLFDATFDGTETFFVGDKHLRRRKIFPTRRPNPYLRVVTADTVELSGHRDPPGAILLLLPHRARSFHNRNYFLNLE